MPLVKSHRPDHLVPSATSTQSPEHVHCPVCGSNWFRVNNLVDLAAELTIMRERGCGVCESDFSASQLDTAARCLRRWAWARIDGIKEPETNAQKDGTAYHAAAERFLLTGEIDHSGKYGEWLSAAIPFLPEPPVQPGEVEQWIRFAVDGIGFRGRVDLMRDGGQTIIDHKTCADLSKYAKNADTLRADIQANLYAFGVRRDQRYGITGPVKLRWVYTQKKGRAQAQPTDVELAPTEAAEFFQARILPLAKRLKVIREECKTAADLPPTPTACGDYGGCYYGKIGVCKVSAIDMMASYLGTNGKEDADMSDNLKDEVAGMLANLPKRGKVQREAPPATKAAEPAAEPAADVDTDDEEAELLAKLAAKKAAKAAAEAAAKAAAEKAAAEAAAKAAAEMLAKKQAAGLVTSTGADSDSPEYARIGRLVVELFDLLTRA